MQSLSSLSLYHQTRLIPYARELLHLLHDNKYTIAVITNGTSDLSCHPDLDSLIDVFVNPELCGDSKPSVIPYHRVGITFLLFLLGHGKRWYL